MCVSATLALLELNPPPVCYTMAQYSCQQLITVINCVLRTSAGIVYSWLITAISAGPPLNRRLAVAAVFAIIFISVRHCDTAAAPASPVLSPQHWETSLSFKINEKG